MYFSFESRLFRVDTQKGTHMDLSVRTRITVVPDVLASPVGNETVLLNPETELCMIIDENGVAMWHALAATSSIQDAFEQLRREFDVEPDQLRNDLVDFVGKLWIHTMVVIKYEPDTLAAQQEIKSFAVAV
jgi:hypothetical protein